MADLLMAGAVAVLLGVVVARLMRVAGLVLVLGLLIAGGLAGLATDWLDPVLPEAALALVLVQAGYLLGAVILPAPKPAAADASPLASGDDRAAG